MMFVNSVIRLVALIALCILSTSAESAVELYVSPSGSDTNAGTELKPFATIEKARDTVRGFAKNQPITVYLMPGVYTLRETLTFGVQDSGSADFPVTYKSYGRPGSARLTSGAEIEQWVDEGGGVYSADLPRFAFALTENEEGGVVSREPDPGEGQAPVGCNLTEDGVSSNSIMYREDHYESFGFADAFIRIWPANWQYQHFPVTNVDFASRIVSFEGTLWESGSVQVRDNTRFYLEHAREFIDEPGEFYVDSSVNKLYYMPRSLPITEQVIRVPTLSTLVAIRGNGASNRVHDIHFEGLALSDVNSKRPGSSDSASRGISIFRAESLEFRKMLIENAGDRGIHFWEAVSNVGIFDSIIRNHRFDGIYAGSNAARNSFIDQATPLVGDITDITIRNCAISNVGNCAISLSGTEDVEIAYCELYNCDRVGVYILTSSNCHVHHNDIHDTALNYKDVAGGIYTNIMGRFHRFEDNRIYNVSHLDHDEGTPGKAIYLDYDGNADIAIRNNVMFNIAVGGQIVKLGGERILFDNNVVDNRGNQGETARLEFWGGSHRIRWVSWLSDEIVSDKDMTLTNNVFLQSESNGGNFIRFNSIEGWVDTVEVGVIPETLTASDHNLFYNADIDVDEYLICNYDIADWRSLGGKAYDAHSLFGSDPMFFDMDSHDYRFAEGSPLFDLGMGELDAATVKGVGLRSNFPEFAEAGTRFVSLNLWRNEHFEPSLLNEPSKELVLWGDHADPDKDGILNLVEYFMGLDPNVKDADQAWALIEVGDVDNTIVFRYRRSKDVGVDLVRPQYSLDMINWRAIEHQEIVDLGEFEMVYAIITDDHKGAAVYARLAGQ